MAKRVTPSGVVAGDVLAVLPSAERAECRVALCKVEKAVWVLFSTDEKYLLESLKDFSGGIYRLGPRGGVPATVKPLLKRGVFDMAWVKENLEACKREGEKLAKKERARLARTQKDDDDDSDDDEDDDESSEEESSGDTDETSDESNADAKPKKKSKASKDDADDGAAGATSKGKDKKAKKSGKSRFPDSWVASESRGPAKIGKELPEKAKLVWHEGDRGVAKVKDVLFGIAVVGSFTCPADKAEVDDVRILDMKYAKDGVTRKRTFTSAVDDSYEPSKRPPDWPIRGPTSALWLVTQMQEGNVTPKQRHFWWRQVLGLQAGDVGVDDHFFLSELFELAMCYDQVNAGTSAVLEAISRRYQLHEEINSEALKVADAGEGNSEWAEERRLFLGAPQSRASALIMPALKEHIAAEVAKEAAIMKERRKAREERLLLTPQSAGDAGDKTGKARGRGGRK